MGRLFRGPEDYFTPEILALAKREGVPRPNTYVRAMEAEPLPADVGDAATPDERVTVSFTADFESGEVAITDRQVGSAEHDPEEG